MLLLNCVFIAAVQPPMLLLMESFLLLLLEVLNVAAGDSPHYCCF